MKTQARAAEATKIEYYTVEDVMAILDISRPTVMELIRDGKIRSYKVSKRVRVPVPAIDEFINSVIGEACK